MLPLSPDAPPRDHPLLSPHENKEAGSRAIKEEELSGKASLPRTLSECPEADRQRSSWFHLNRCGFLPHAQASCPLPQKPASQRADFLHVLPCPRPATIRHLNAQERPRSAPSSFEAPAPRRQALSLNLSAGSGEFLLRCRAPGSGPSDAHCPVFFCRQNATLQRASGTLLCLRWSTPPGPSGALRKISPCTPPASGELPCRSAPQ